MQSDHSLEPLRGLVSHLLAGDQQHFDSEFDAMLDRFSYESMRGMLGCDEYWLLLAKFIQRYSAYQYNIWCAEKAQLKVPDVRPLA